MDVTKPTHGPIAPARSRSASARRLQQLQLVVWRCGQKPFSTHQPLSSEFFQISPKASRLDEKIHIKAQGLPSQEKVTLHASVDSPWRQTPVQFVSCGHYFTNSDGEVDLQRDFSVGGTYTGVDPMGLFWSMKPSPSGPQNIRMVIKNVKLPIVYNLSIFLGHLTLNELDSVSTGHQPISTKTLERTVMPADVRRIPVKEGSVRGTLFLPPGEGPFQGVIDMFGLAGGLMEGRAAMLAAHGFAVIALPLYGYDDLPKQFKNLAFEYLEDAVHWISSHPSVRPGGIGAIGTSGGGSLATVMAWMCPEVKAFVRINGPWFLCETDLYYKGHLLRRGVLLDYDRVYEEDGAARSSKGWTHTDADFIPSWEKDVHVLTLSSGDDAQFPPEEEKKFYQLCPENRRHLIEAVYYPGAGHLLEPPYTPLCRSCFNPHYGGDMLWGGYPADHAAAQEDSWRRILNFFRKHLPSEN